MPSSVVLDRDVVNGPDMNVGVFSMWSIGMRLRTSNRDPGLIPELLVGVRITASDARSLVLLGHVDESGLLVVESLAATRSATAAVTCSSSSPASPPCGT